jgi:hypothetical protein
MSGSVFELQQIFQDPRTEKWDVVTSYSTYESRADAMREARKLKGRWRVIETRIVAIDAATRAGA